MNKTPIEIRLPLTRERALGLKAGDAVNLSGTLYTARDAAHARLFQLLDSGRELPIDLDGAAIYYTGPCPAGPGEAIGSCGPTTSGRMDAFTPRLLALGLRAMIGKGGRSVQVIDAMRAHGAVYLAAAGGAGALLARSVRRCAIAAFEDLGAEAIYRLEVEDFPAIVAIDATGESYYESGPARYLAVRRESGS